MRKRPATLVVIEFGASWPRWLNPAQAGDVAVVAQHYQGLPTDLVTQVASRITRLTHAGWQLEEVVLVANGRTDPAATAARSVLARGLVGHLRGSQGRKLTLSVGDGHGRRSSHDLTMLAAALEPVTLVSELSLCVRVGDAEPLLGRAAPSRPVAQSA